MKKIKILWVPNLGSIPVIWALFVVCKASPLTVAIACASIYALNCVLDMILSLLPPIRSVWDEA